MAGQSKMRIELCHNIKLMTTVEELKKELIHIWSHLLREYKHVSTDIVIESSNIATFVDHIKNILLEENNRFKKLDSEMVQQCLIYVMQEKIFEALVNIGIGDRPVGIRFNILDFFSILLRKIYSLPVDHKELYVPLIMLLNVCQGRLHSPYKEKESEFIFELCSVIWLKRWLAPLFLSKAADNQLLSISENVACVEFSNIMDIALRYMDIEDIMIRHHASKCVLYLCSVTDSNVCVYIMKSTRLVYGIIAKLEEYYNNLPLPNRTGNNTKVLPSEENGTVDIAPVHSLASYSSSSQSSALSYLNSTSYELFSSWLSFIDQVVDYSLFPVNLAIVREMDVLLSKIFSPAEMVSPAKFSLFTKYYSKIMTGDLLNCFGTWFKGYGVEEKDGLSNPFTLAITNNALSNSTPLVKYSLQFILNMIRKSDDDMLQYLIFCYVQDRSYYGSISLSIFDNINAVHFRTPLVYQTAHVGVITNKIIKSFAYMVPASVSSCSDNRYRMTSFPHIRSLYPNMLKRASDLNWPDEIEPEDEVCSIDLVPEADQAFSNFYEGPILRMIFTKIRDMPYDDFRVTMDLMMSVKRLMLIQHAYLQEYLLNPLLTTHLKNSLYKCLKETVDKLIPKIIAIPNYKEELIHTRRRLMSRRGFDDSYNRREFEPYLEAIVTIDALCNDIAALIYVKSSERRYIAMNDWD